MSKTTVNNSSKRTIKFYTKFEKKELLSIAQEPKIDKNKVVELSKISGRTYNALILQVYLLRKKLNIKKTKNTNTVVKPSAVLTTANTSIKASPSLTKGEVKIPISNWDLKSENGQMYFVAKF